MRFCTGSCYSKKPFASLHEASPILERLFHARVVVPLASTAVAQTFRLSLKQSKVVGMEAVYAHASLTRVLASFAGRVDDLWSWLYMVVEMLEGTLPWRAKTGSPGLAGGGGKGATGGGSGGSSANGEENPKVPLEKDREGPKEAAQRWKQQCLDDPNRLSVSGQLPSACLLIARTFPKPAVLPRRHTSS